jgi:hypothetical protein
MGSVPAGSYHLGFDAKWEDASQPAEIELTVRQGVAHFFPLVLAVLALAAWPFATGLFQLVFEARRWQESNTN